MEHPLLINSNADFIIFFGAAVFLFGAGYLLYNTFYKSNSDKSSEVTPESLKNYDNRAETFKDSNLSSEALVAVDPTNMCDAAKRAGTQDQIEKNTNTLTETEDFSDLPELEPALDDTKIVFHSYRFPERNFHLLESADKPSTSAEGWCPRQPDYLNTSINFESSQVLGCDKFKFNNATIPLDSDVTGSLNSKFFINDPIGAFSLDSFNSHLIYTVDRAYSCLGLVDKPFLSYADSNLNALVNLIERLVLLLEQLNLFVR